MLSKMWCIVFVFLCFNSLVRCEDSGVYVNCAKIPTRTTSSHNGVNAIGTCEFYGDEKVFVSCPKSPGGSRILSDSFAYIGNDKTERQMGKNRTTYLYIKLTEKSNNKYVDCEKYILGNKYTTRIYFKRTGTSPSSSSSVPCDEKLSFVKTLEECYTNDDTPQRENTTCAFQGRGLVPVKGLLEDKMMAVFFKNKFNMIIVYEYNKMGDEMNLQCISATPWKYDNSTIQVIAKNGNTDMHTFKINHPTMTDITCKSENSSTKIIFIKVTPRIRTHKVKVNEQAHDANSSNKTNEKSEEGLQSGSEDSNVQESTNKAQISTLGSHDGRGLLIIAGGVTIVILVLVVVFVCLIKILKKKAKAPNPDVNISYETLPEHNQGAMPIPSQWQEVHYASPDDRIANDDYAVPHRPTVEEMYTKPLPKNARKNTRDNLGYESVDELFPTISASSRPTLNKVLPTPAKRTPNIQNNTCARVKFDDNYSETASENPYAELNLEEGNVNMNAGYSNVFDGQKYVNSNCNKSDYAEPAYCEPSKV